MSCYIYGLCSSENDIIRYVGKTKNNLNNRLNEHKCDALTKKFKNHKCNWIRKVYNDGFELKIVLIEETDELNWEEREIYWIKKYENLTNQLIGGQSGGVGGKLFPYSYKEVKEKLIELKLSFSNFREYKRYIKENKNLKEFFPLNPKKVFTRRNEWISWGDFLNNEYVSDKEKYDRIVSYDEAKKIVNENNITSSTQYYEFAKTRDYLPLNPDRSYKSHGWVSWYDFFGVKKTTKCSYEAFCRYISIYFDKSLTYKKYQKLITSGKISKRLPYHYERNYGKNWSAIKKEIFG